jgi:hypothetical protein
MLWNKPKDQDQPMNVVSAKERFRYGDLRSSHRSSAGYDDIARTLESHAQQAKRGALRPL